jgi:hypothetical protein
LGKRVRNWIEKTVFERIPGYTLIRSLAHQVAGQSRGSTWKAALVEIADALVPAFIIEELDDERYTVFVPSIPTPFAGAVYVLDRQRVHPVDVPFPTRSGSSPVGRRCEGPGSGDEDDGRAGRSSADHLEPLSIHEAPIPDAGQPCTVCTIQLVYTMQRRIYARGSDAG